MAARNIFGVLFETSVLIGTKSKHCEFKLSPACLPCEQEVSATIVPSEAGGRVTVFAPHEEFELDGPERLYPIA